MQPDPSKNGELMQSWCDTLLSGAQSELCFVSGGNDSVPDLHVGTEMLRAAARAYYLPRRPDRQQRATLVLLQHVQPARDSAKAVFSTADVGSTDHFPTMGPDEQEAPLHMKTVVTQEETRAVPAPRASRSTVSPHGPSPAYW